MAVVISKFNIEIITAGKVAHNKSTWNIKSRRTLIKLICPSAVIVSPIWNKGKKQNIRKKLYIDDSKK